MAMFSTALDWPLSREEKKGQLMRLYSDDAKAADGMLCAGNKTLEALREELDNVRCAGADKAEDAEEEVQRLRQGLESAAAVLRAILLKQDEDEPASCAEETSDSRSRARSEGASREPAAVALRPALCRTPRQSSRPKRRVSFGSQPEEEPAHDSDIGQDRHRNSSTARVVPSGPQPWAQHTGPFSAHQPQTAPMTHPCYPAGYATGSLPSGFAPPVPGYNWHPTAPSGYGDQPPGTGWGPFYNQFSGYGDTPAPQQQETMEIFVEAAPEIQPDLQRGANGTFEMYVPGVRVKLSTTCIPLPKQYLDLAGFRPYEEFVVALPEVQRFIFDPRANMPPNGRVWCQAQKRGAVIELPPHIVMNAKLKTSSPFGSVILESTSSQGEVGETILNYRLQVDGQLAKRHGNMSSNRLEVELNFIFDCYIGGQPVAPPSASQGSEAQQWGHFRPMVAASPPQEYRNTGMHRVPSEGRFSSGPF